MWHYRALLLRESRFHLFGRLTNEYLVDMFSRNLDCRLSYIRQNQRRIRAEDAELMGEQNIPDNENIYLPASFLGSWRWASNQVSDCLAIAAALGGPTFFITMTCNSEWDEIKCRLGLGQDYTDIPIDVVRVFKRKLCLFEQTLKTMFPNSGGQTYSVHSIEFQKRGLPHAHILTKYKNDCVLPGDIDSVISAEVPDDPEDARLVETFMIHHHPPAHREMSKYCQREDINGNRSCRFGYPQPLQPVTTIDTQGRIHYRRRNDADRWVVPFCLPLLRKYRCHLNFECANTSHLFQYLFKYVHKGSHEAHAIAVFSLLTFSLGADYTRYRLLAGDGTEPVDEIADYWRGRYLSSGESAWRVMGFHITKKNPAVGALPVHLPSSTTFRQYNRRDNSQSSLSQLDHYFLRPIGSYTSRDGSQLSFDDLCYSDYYRMFRLAKYDETKDGRPNYYREQANRDASTPQHVILRDHTHPYITRIHSVLPSQGELFYLRTILQHQPRRSFQDTRTVENILYSTFQEAAVALGMFANEKEAEYALNEAIRELRTPRQLRLLFVLLLVNDCVTTPLHLWEVFQRSFSQDHVLRHNNVLDVGINYTLEDLNNSLEEHGKTVADYGLPEPIIQGREIEREIERWGSDPEALAARAQFSVTRFNAEQLEIYNAVTSAVREDRQLLAFVDGKGGRGKTFVLKTICDYVRSTGRLFLPAATSAFAAQNYEGGRTVHSVFKVRKNVSIHQCVPFMEIRLGSCK